MDSSKNKGSTVKNKYIINEELKKIFEVRLKQKQNDNNTMTKEFLSTQTTDVLETSVSPKSRYMRISNIQSPFQEQKRLYTSPTQQHFYIKDKGNSLFSTRTPNTPLNNQNRNQNPFFLANKQISSSFNKNQSKMSQFISLSKQSEIAQTFNRTNTSQTEKFSNLIMRHPEKQEQKPYQIIFKKLAPITTIYNESQVFEKKKLNTSLSFNFLPRYYFKNRNRAVEKEIGKLQACKVIDDISKDKKINMRLH